MRYIHILCMVFSCYTLTASIKGKVVNQKGEPIPNTNIHWLNTSSGTITDENGIFQIPENKSSNQLIISNVSFVSDTIIAENNYLEYEIILMDRVQLTEVSVIGKNTGTFKLKTTLLNIEKITSAELSKAACCNLSESFETNPSVDVSYSDATTGAKQIKMLGLPGTYVQMLTENIPNLRGISAPFGMGFIPGPWMESIQVSKGTASVVNGYEAITGQINVEFKKPTSDEKIAFNLFASDAGRLESNLNASILLNKKLSTGILLHASDEVTSFDNNNDGFMDMPMIKQYNFINRWMYNNDKYFSQAFVRALKETRHGGQMSGSYKIMIESERLEFFLKNGIFVNDEKSTSIALIVSGSTHKQASMYGSKSYTGKQNSLYSNLIFLSNIDDKNKLTAGVNINYDKYNEHIPILNSNPVIRTEFVSGAYSEYSYKIAEKLSAMAGVRFDYNSLHGYLLTPRMHVKYSLTDRLLFRFSAGKGYRSPNILAENNFLLAGNRALIIAPEVKIEKAWNYGISTLADVHIGEKEIVLAGEWYYTDFKQQIVEDLDTDPHKVFFTNLIGKSFSHSVQVEASSEILKGLNINIAHRVNIVKTTIRGILRDKPLTNKSKSLFTLSYQTPLKKWQFDYTAQFNGSGRMPDPDKTNPLWKSTFDPYTIMNAQITKYFKKWSIYLGGENLTNFVQKNPIIDVIHPGSDNFDASMIWGPLHGRKFYIGMRWALNREK